MELWLLLLYIVGSRLFRFVCGGTVSTLLLWVILFLLTNQLGVWYIFSFAIGYIITRFINFLFQKYWTFRHSGRERIAAQGGMYILMSCLIGGANAFFLYLLVEALNSWDSDLQGVWYLLVEILISIPFGIASYYGTKRILSPQPKL